MKGTDVKRSNRIADRPGTRWAALAFLLGTIAWLVPLPAMAQDIGLGAETLSHRDQVTLRMVQLARAGMISEARDALRNFLADHPGDGTMLYNLACFDLVLADNEQALVDLERALAAGYTNFRLIDNDKDLGPLREDPRFTEMVAAYEQRFRQEFQERTLVLAEGYESRNIELWPNDAAAGDETAPTAQADAKFTAGGIQITLRTDDARVDDSAPPWLGGSGVLVNLVLPLSPDDYESRRYHSYGFGALQGRPTAALVGRHGEILLQDTPELAPKITRQGETATYEITIPWHRFEPYAPPLDQELGLNVFYVAAGKDAGRQTLSLMPESRLSFELNPWRRYVPVYFDTSDRSQPALHGRLYERLIEKDTVDIQLALWSATVGSGSCRLWITGADGTPWTKARITDEPFIEDDLNFLNYSLDVTALEPGAYLLNVEFTGPDGVTLPRRYPFSRFRPDWISSLNLRVHELPSAEKSILKYHLYSLAQDLDRRHPQDEPGIVGDVYRLLVQRIAQCEATGSCLPESGYFVGGFAEDQKHQRYCAMYLPVGYREFAEPRLLVVTPPQPGSEEALARAVGEALATDDQTIVIVPQSNGYSGLTGSRAARNTELAITWSQELFGAGPVHLVGLGSGADAALELSLKRPDLCTKVLLSADDLLVDMESLNTAVLQQTLTASLYQRTNELHYTLVSQHAGGGRGPVIAGTMQQAGFSVDGRLWDVQQPLGSRVAGWVAAIGEAGPIQ